MNERAVVDRLEGTKAVLLIGDNEQKMVVEYRQLPAGTNEGDWLQVEVHDGRLVKAESDKQATQRARARIKSKLVHLRKGDHRR